MQEIENNNLQNNKSYKQKKCTLPPCYCEMSKSQKLGTGYSVTNCGVCVRHWDPTKVSYCDMNNSTVAEDDHNSNNNFTIIS